LVERVAHHGNGKCAEEEEGWMDSNKHDGRGDQVQSVGSRYASHDISIQNVQRGLLRKMIILCPICLLLYPSAPSHKYLIL
jgi:hypothetical protein